MGNRINKVVKGILTSSMHGETFLSNAVSYLTNSKNANYCERKVSYGEEHPEKVFYVIKRSNDWGLGSVLAVYIRYFDYALRRGWIPVVDMQNAHNLYLKDDRLNEDRMNSWELFFEQPGGYSLDDIRNAKSIVFASHQILIKNNYEINPEVLNSVEKVHYWQRVAGKCIRFNDATNAYISEARSQTFSDVPTSEKILGVYCRGTDYLDIKPKGHPVQPSPEMAISKTKEVMREENVHYIYLVTEDERILSLFKQEFAGDGQLLYLPAQRYGVPQMGEEYIWQRQAMLKRNRFINGVEYLAALQLLAECDMFIGAVTGGTAAMMLMQHSLPPFSYQFIWNLGSY